METFYFALLIAAALGGVALAAGGFGGPVALRAEEKGTLAWLARRHARIAWAGAALLLLGRLIAGAMTYTVTVAYPPTAGAHPGKMLNVALFGGGPFIGMLIQFGVYVLWLAAAGWLWQRPAARGADKAARLARRGAVLVAFGLVMNMVYHFFRASFPTTETVNLYECVSGVFTSLLTVGAGYLVLALAARRWPPRGGEDESTADNAPAG